MQLKELDVLIDARYIDLTGIGTYVRNLIQAALEKGASSSSSGFLFSSANREKKLPEQLREAGFRVYVIRALPFDIREHYQLFMILHRIRPGCYFIPHFNVPLIRPSGVKMVTVIHDLEFDLFPEQFRTPFHKLYYRIIMPRALKADRLIAVSRYTAQTVREIYGTDCHTVIFSPFDCAYEEQVALTERDQFHLLFVGVNKLRKNLSVLVRAMAILPSAYHLTIAGRWESPHFNVQTEVAKLGLQDRVRIAGFVSEMELHELYHSAGILVIPSLMEGFGYPILEGAIHKIPVVAARSSSLPEVGGDGCAYFDPLDEQDLVEAILAVNRSEQSRKNLVMENSRRPSLFQASRIYDALMEVCRETLKA